MIEESTGRLLMVFVTVVGLGMVAYGIDKGIKETKEAAKQRTAFCESLCAADQTKCFKFFMDK
jgi:hypothetical protein